MTTRQPFAYLKVSPEWGIDAPQMCLRARSTANSACRHQSQGREQRSISRIFAGPGKPKGGAGGGPEGGSVSGASLYSGCKYPLSQIGASTQSVNGRWVAEDGTSGLYINPDHARSYQVMHRILGGPQLPLSLLTGRRSLMRLIMATCSLVQFDRSITRDGGPLIHHILPGVARTEREKLKHSPHREPCVVALIDARPSASGMNLPFLYTRNSPFLS